MTAFQSIVAGRRLRILRRPTESIRPSTPRPARRDCHGRLLIALVDLAGPSVSIADSRLEPWASATFVGARHLVTLSLVGEDAPERAEALSQTLPEAQFALPGHIVADLAVDTVAVDGSGDAVVELSILTIEAW